MFKTVDKEKFISLMALVVVSSALFGAWLEKIFVSPHHIELTLSAARSAVEHGALGLTIFLYLFAHFIWKMRILRWLGIVKYPNLSGKWVGGGRSSTFANEYPVICRISQDAWGVSWDFEVYGKGTAGGVTSSNKPLAVEFTNDDAQTLFLNVVYQNGVKLSNKAGFSANHNGACRLELSREVDPKTGTIVRSLEGVYWTNKTTDAFKCTTGEFLLKEESSRKSQKRRQVKGWLVNARVQRNEPN
jgi:hypothetical protein